MKNILSFEIAKALKDAGFPQPTAETGQFWYFIRYPEGAFRHGVLCIVMPLSIEDSPSRNIRYLPLDGGNKEFSRNPIGIFAPTATDILEQLGEYFSIGSWKGKFVINQHPELLPEPIGAPARYHGTHDNPAEAAAAAWLALKKDLEV